MKRDDQEAYIENSVVTQANKGKVIEFIISPRKGWTSFNDD
jgi:hypothetical protein